MKLATFQHAGAPTLGLVDQDLVLALGDAQRKYGHAALPETMTGLIAEGSERLASLKELAAKVPRTDSTVWLPLDSVQLLAPIPNPAKNVFCVGRNYKAHIEEGARARGNPAVFPQVPEFFTKPPTSVIGHCGTIDIDEDLTQQLDYEVELAIVIGRKCRDVPAERALDVVFGYTVLNDVTARDLQRMHGIPFKGKSLDTSCPIGPWIVTADEFGDPAGHRICLRVNGETRQDSSTGDLLFDCAAIVASLSRGLTLEPGDIIATGTPSGVAMGMKPQAWLKNGDIVEAEVEGIGVLTNVVRRS